MKRTITIELTVEVAEGEPCTEAAFEAAVSEFESAVDDVLDAGTLQDAVRERYDEVRDSVEGPTLDLVSAVVTGTSSVEPPKVQRRTDRPAELRHGDYLATLFEEHDTPCGVQTSWAITRNGARVGTMFQGGGGYGERVTCSMNALLWNGGAMPKSWPPKEPTYGLGFDIGPQETREDALRAFAHGADALIAWREGT